MVMPNGSVAVEGNIENKITTYGLLELAKEAIADHHRQAQQRVQLAPAGSVPGLTGHN
jgi:hypothetical protein